MTGVLGPDDLDSLTLVLSFFKYSSLSLSTLFKVTIRISYIWVELVLQIIRTIQIKKNEMK